MYFWNNRPSEQRAFVFGITACRTNGLSVQWDIFWTIGALELWAVRTIGSPLLGPEAGIQLVISN